MKPNSLIQIILFLLLTGTLTIITQASKAQDVYIDENCRHNPNLQQIDRFVVFYSRKFTTNNQTYWLYATRYQDGAVLFCVSRPNFVQPQLIQAEEISFQFIEKIDQNGNNSPNFHVQVRHGQNINVPLSDYRLNLTNPARPKVTPLSPPIQATSLGDLPSGDYSNGSLILRKSSNIILGARSEDSICFRGQLTNGRIFSRWDTVPVFADRSGNYRRRFQSNFDEQFPIDLSFFRPAEETEKTALDRCTDRFRPLVNLGINIRMTDTAVLEQLAKFNWRRSYNLPIADIPSPIAWDFELFEDGVLCDKGGNYCILTWKKQEKEISIIIAVGVLVNNRPPVIEICLTDRQSFGRTCQFSDVGNDDGTR